MSTHGITLYTLAIASLLSTSHAAAQVPGRLPVQGFLQDAAGDPVHAPTSITVSIYETPSEGAALYSETQNVSVTDGRFVIYAGATQPIPWTLLDGAERLYVGLTVADDAELSPRFELATVPFAARADEAMTLQGATAADFSLIGHRHGWDELDGVPADLTDGDADTLGNLNCPTGQVIRAGRGGGWGCSTDRGLTQVSTNDIVTGAVTSTKLADNAVTSTKIAGDAVTSAKIASGAVTNSDLASNAVTSAKIASGAVSNSDLASNAVTASKIASGAVQNSELASGAVTNSKLNLTVSDHCVRTNQVLLVVPNKQFCALIQTPNGLTCSASKSGGDYHLNQSPPGSDHCCMRCF